MRKRYIVIAFLGVLLGAYAVLRVYLAVAIRSELNALREMGYPATAAELNAWYATPPEGQNAADEYLLAFDAFTDEGIDCELLPISGCAPDIPLDVTLPEAELAEIGRYIELNALALEHLHRAAQMPGCRWPSDFEHPRWLEPEYWDSDFEAQRGRRYAARLLAEEALYYRDTGNADAALRSIAETLAIGGAIAGHPSVMFYLTASSINSMAFNSLQNLMATIELSDAQLVMMQRAFREAEQLLSLASALLGDALEFRPMLDMMISQYPVFLMNPTEDYDKKELPVDIARLAGLLVYRYSGMDDSDYLHILRGTKHYIALCALPSHEAIQHAKEPLPEYALGSLPAISKDFLYMRFAMIDLQFVIAAVNEARFRIAGTALAVERFRLEYSRLPERLEELVPAYLTAAPIDPVDGQPLRYRRDAGDFVLYSIGRNLIDDGGYGFQDADNEDDDIVFSVFRQRTRG